MNIAKTIRVTPGRYVLAVSGGVDSMALLDILKTRPDLKLTVAHFDHGIRDDSAQDKRLIQDIAKANGLPFVYDKAELGKGASEEAARKARYEFLRKVKQQAGAHGIITAHHLDDAVETAVHNILRGTGRKGMSPMHAPGGDIVRPMLHLPKEHIVGYAKARRLAWREDSTNTDTAYRRNYIRHEILPKLQERSPKEYERLKRLIRRQAELNRAIDEQLTHLLHMQDKQDTINRHAFIMLPHDVSREVIAHWLRLNGRGQSNVRQIDKLASNLKTARAGSRHVIDNTKHFIVDKKSIRLHSKG